MALLKISTFAEKLFIAFKKKIKKFLHNYALLRTWLASPGNVFTFLYSVGVHITCKYDTFFCKTTEK